MDRPYGIWTNEEARFLCVADVTGSPVGLAVEQSTFAFCDATAAACAIQSLAKLTGFADLEALALREADRPETWDYLPLRTPEDVAERLAARKLYPGQMMSM